MLQLDSNQNLTSDTQARLTTLQEQVNSEINFSGQAVKAQSLWDNKGGSAIGRATFQEIREKLKSMCVSVGICNYCEQSEANDIEHIYPKSFFPDFAFVWSNYLLACKQCNTAFKLDKCFVIDNIGNIHETIRGQKPSYNIVALINPRLEDPADYMIINTQNFTFEINEDLSTERYNKADKTLDILALNTRDTLIETRKAAARYFYHRMELLVKIINAETIEQVHHLLTPHDQYLDDNKTLNELKDLISIGFKKDIKQYPHPSVWAAIKVVDSKTNSKWAYLFKQFPEALNW